MGLASEERAQELETAKELVELRNALKLLDQAIDSPGFNVREILGGVVQHLTSAKQHESRFSRLAADLRSKLTATKGEGEQLSGEETRVLSVARALATRMDTHITAVRGLLTWLRGMIFVPLFTQHAFLSAAATIRNDLQQDIQALRNALILEKVIERQTRRGVRSFLRRFFRR